MTMDLRRSTHPDLLDELDVVQAEPASDERTRPRRRRNGTSPPEAPPPEPTAETPPEVADDSADQQPPVPAESTPPEWMSAVDATPDPREKLRLLVKNVPRDEMEQDDVLRGWLGDYANQRARRMLEDQARVAQDRERQQAYDRGDLYALGQLDAANLEQQRQLARQQAELDANPYLIGIRNFQASLPEAVQREVQGKQYATYEAYLSAVQDAAIRHGVSEEVRKRSSALEKAQLSQTVGSEMSPELDGGPAQTYREITDAQVAAMTLEEFDRYFDDKGRPRPGVRVRLERGIDIRAQQR